MCLVLTLKKKLERIKKKYYSGVRGRLGCWARKIKKGPSINLYFVNQNCKVCKTVCYTVALFALF
jgi:hypothetical protein